MIHYILKMLNLLFVIFDYCVRTCFFMVLQFLADVFDFLIILKETVPKVNICLALTLPCPIIQGANYHFFKFFPTLSIYATCEINFFLTPCRLPLSYSAPRQLITVFLGNTTQLFIKHAEQLNPTKYFRSNPIKYIRITLLTQVQLNRGIAQMYAFIYLKKIFL